MWRSGLDKYPRIQLPVDHSPADYESVDYFSRNQHHRRTIHVDNHRRIRIGSGGGQSLRVDGVVVGGVGGARDPR